MAGEFNRTAQRLIAALLQDHPEWQQYAAPYGPADDAEADVGSVIFSIPSSAQPTHHLEIAQRGNIIEVAYDCGEVGVRAEQQFIFDEADAGEALVALRRFLRDLDSGYLVIVREPLGRIVRALRRDEVAELASFRSATPADTPRPGTTVHRWSRA